MRAHPWMGPVALVVLAACQGDRRAMPEDASVGRDFGEPCLVSEDCASSLCVRTTPFRGVCTRLCDSDVGCPGGPSWGCVRPSGFELSVCGCVADGAEEICGDGLDNDCNGEADDCRLCFGMPVAENDPRHCGECGNACRADQRCSDGECVCDAIGTTECSGACVDVDVDERHCGSCDTACGVDQACRAGECLCPDATAPDHCEGVGCVDLATDEDHCGACGESCPGDTLCVSGSCECPVAGETWCGDTAGCVPTASHEAHCGACGTACDGGQVCIDGSCECPTDWPDRCDGVCVDTTDDAANCGGCGNVCPTGTVCTGGTCQCPVSGWERCAGTCVDVASNETHCGSCGTTCLPGEVCSAGTCTCASGLHCGGECVSPADRSNCGGCGVSCGSTQYCLAGTCRCSSSSLTACGTACVATATDESNCGGCGIACRTSEVCISGSCVCPSGQTYCASVDACVDTRSSTSHCGGCDVACSPTQICSSGTCRCSDSGALYCASTGACTDTLYNTSHCGACDVSCNPTEVCSAGSCRCPSYYQRYCASATSCIDLRSSDDHCGACDAACPSDATCVSSACACADSALTACPGEPSCVDLQTDASHCGSCGTPCSSTEVCAAGSCTCPPPIGGTETRLTTNTINDGALQVASNGTRLAIVWRRDGLGWFQLLEGDGTPVAGTLSEVGTSGVTIGPTLDVVWNGTDWVVFYQEDVAGSRPLRIQRYDAGGAPVGAYVDVTAASGVTFPSPGLEIAFSPISGYAGANYSYFQYLGADGTTPGPRFHFTSGPDDVAVAGSPTTGEWGLVETGYDGPAFYVFDADGALSSPPIDLGWRPYAYNWENVAALTHDGVTWVAAMKHEGLVSPSTYTDEVHLRRGPALETEAVVHRAPRLEEYGDARIQRISIHTDGGRAVVSWSQHALGTYDTQLLARRYALPSAATSAATPVDAAYVVVPTYSVVQIGWNVLFTGPDRYTGVWMDKRHANWELYSVAADVSACP